MSISKNIKIFILTTLCFLLIACKGSSENAAVNDQWSEFYGAYEGSAESVLAGELSERELTVSIKPWKETGFTVAWTTLIKRANGATKLSDLSIDFYPSERPGIYTSAMQPNVFGSVVPYDPVGEDGDPYVWAGLEGKTLTVRALYIADDGGYEMHVYKRSLNEKGLALEFERLSNGDKASRVSAQLVPVE